MKWTILLKFMQLKTLHQYQLFRINVNQCFQMNLPTFLQILFHSLKFYSTLKECFRKWTLILFYSSRSPKDKACTSSSSKCTHSWKPSNQKEWWASRNQGCSETAGEPHRELWWEVVSQRHVWWWIRWLSHKSTR